MPTRIPPNANTKIASGDGILASDESSSAAGSARDVIIRGRV
jgi:hypothetical protein